LGGAKGDPAEQCHDERCEFFHSFQSEIITLAMFLDSSPQPLTGPTLQVRDDSPGRPGCAEMDIRRLPRHRMKQPVLITLPSHRFNFNLSEPSTGETREKCGNCGKSRRKCRRFVFSQSTRRMLKAKEKPGFAIVRALGSRQLNSGSSNIVVSGSPDMRRYELILRSNSGVFTVYI
jgi:hypothetical protein